VEGNAFLIVDGDIDKGRSWGGGVRWSPGNGESGVFNGVSGVGRGENGEGRRGVGEGKSRGEEKRDETSKGHHFVNVKGEKDVERREESNAEEGLRLFKERRERDKGEREGSFFSQTCKVSKV